MSDEADTPKESLMWRAMRVVARVLTTQLCDLRIYGMENIPPTGGVLIVSNHQSYLDPIILAVRLKRPMSYFAKQELFKNPAFGRFIRALNAFPVDRSRGDVAAIKETVRRLDEGHVLSIFPEGTRSTDGEVKKFLSGTALVIRRSTATVIPAAVDGSYDAWPKGHKLPRPHPLRVMYGKPIDVTGLKGDEIMKRLEHAVRTLLEELRSKRDEYRGPTWKPKTFLE